MMHGEILINDDVVYVWQAERTDKYVGKGFHIYECLVEGRDLQGYPVEGRFFVTHLEYDGALSLTSKIMTEALANMKRKQPVV